MADIDNIRIASVLQRLPERVSKREWKLVLAMEWHHRLVDRLKTYPPVGTTIAAWLSLHRQALHSTYVVKEMVRAAGDPWTVGIPRLEHLIAHLNEAIAGLKRLNGRRIIPQAAG